MWLEKTHLLLDNFYNWTLVNFYFPKYKIFHKMESELLKENERFRGLHKGKRCFVVGNGPSLLEQDLSLLGNEVVFTVNQLMRLKSFNSLKTNYHFFADPLMYNLDKDKPEELEIIELMKKIKSKDNDPVCFFPIGAKEFVDKNTLQEYFPVSYFMNGLIFTDKFRREIDYTNYVPGFYTVVQYAVIMAIYMGFEEIYLLGCDMTGHLSLHITEEQHETEQDYAYEVNENEKKRMVDINDLIGVGPMFNGFARMFRDYQKLKDYCDYKGIKLYNSTFGGLIDSIPRKKLENIFK